MGQASWSDTPQGAWDAGEKLPRAPAALCDYLDRQRGEIVSRWVTDARRMGPNYRRRRMAELLSTMEQSYQANLTAVREGDSAVLDLFVAFITRLRLEAGFPLSEVQKAFDLYRVLLTPRVLAVLPPRQAAQSLAAINACVSYQIHSFSDRFQSMHELAIRRHAQNLEQEVELRNQELAASRKRYKALVEEINDGYFVVRGLRIEFVNRSFCAMHAGQPDQLLGRHFLNLVARTDRPRVTRSWRDLMAGRPQPKALEYQRRGLNGLGGATEVRARVVDLGQGPVLIGICRDISQRVAMELKVRENQRMADLGQLTASLSHELRNPLATIKMNLQLLQRRPEISPPDQERLGLAVGEMTRLEGILRQLLDAAKPLTPECEPVEVNHLVADCLKLLQPQLSERGQRIRRSLDPGLGRVSLDRGMLEQALINLLLNAMDAAGPGGHITVSSRPLPGEEATGCLLAVRDNGPGLDPAEQEKVFTPFFTRKGHGTGLGLTNLARIAKAHGGAVRVLSRPGRGAKFILEIPGRP